jgi:hypothetical protein
MADDNSDTIKVARSDYVKWNELWLAIANLAVQWGDDGAHGTELLKAISAAELKAEGVPKPAPPPLPACDTCGQTATHSTRLIVFRSAVPDDAAGEEIITRGDRVYGCDSHPVDGRVAC